MWSEFVIVAAVLQTLQYTFAKSCPSIFAGTDEKLVRKLLNTQLTAYLTEIRRFKSQEDGLMTIHLCLETMEIIILISE